jgi:hypothetical protein
LGDVSTPSLRQALRKSGHDATMSLAKREYVAATPASVPISAREAA